MTDRGFIDCDAVWETNETRETKSYISYIDNFHMATMWKGVHVWPYKFLMPSHNDHIVTYPAFKCNLSTSSVT